MIVATPNHQTKIALVDSYSESHYNGGFFGVNGDTYSTSVSQSFLNGTPGTLERAKFYLSAFGTITGNAYAKLYSHAGAFGTSSVPDTLLATSEPLNVSSLGFSPVLLTFNFSGANKVSLAANTHYVIAVEHTDTVGYNNYIRVSYDATSITHAGNPANNLTGSWAAFRFFDVIFYVYRASSTPNTRTPRYIAPPIYG